MATEEPREVIVEREREPRRSSVGTIVAVIVGVIILILLLMYGLPALTGSGGGSTTDTNVDVNTPPTGTTGN